MKKWLLASIVPVLLLGCASADFSIRTLPPETHQPEPAPLQDADVVPEPDRAPVTPADAPPLTVADPWLRINRSTYRFNAKFDEAISFPIANTYRRLPSPVRSGTRHFLSNLSEVNSALNYAAQLRFGPSLRSAGRFVINSTLGVAGLFDVAARMNLQQSPTGFSTTLATWGVPQGPYLVLPLLGPSTLRDGVGLIGDFGTLYTINVPALYRGTESWALNGLTALDRRANTDFRYYATGSPFEYENVRFLYVNRGLIEDERSDRMH